MKRSCLSLLAAALAVGISPESALAGSTVVSSGNGVTIVSGTHISIGGDVVAGKGPAKTEERQLAGYSGLVIEAPVDMRYAVAATPSMKITAPANILPLVTTEVKRGKLIVGLKKSVTMDSMIRIEAAGPSLASVSLTGSGDLKLSGLTGRSLAVDVSGSGSIAASGQVDSAAFDISGSGDVDAVGLRAQDLRLDVSGAATISAHASRSVKIDLSGSGDITIAGRPKQRSVERSGAGEVTFR